LITGASSGFGEDAARFFAADGCKLVLAARRLDRLDSVADEIRSRGGEVLIVRADVSQRKEIDALVARALDRFGRIDILFNNAGFGRLNWIEGQDPEDDIEAQVRVNLLGTIQLTRAVLPHMLERRSGHIINMSSVAGLIPAPLMSIYCVTKSGIRAFSDALRREVSPFGIHVSTIYPGPASTEFGLHLGESEARRAASKITNWSMSSEYVARRVVELAKKPRRSLVIPFWFHPLVIINNLFPGMVDWVLEYFFVNRYHKLEAGVTHDTSTP
jgi:hypothetical protein